MENRTQINPVDPNTGSQIPPNQINEPLPELSLTVITPKRKKKYEQETIHEPQEREIKSRNPQNTLGHIRCPITHLMKINIYTLIDITPT